MFLRPASSRPQLQLCIACLYLLTKAPLSHSNLTASEHEENGYQVQFFILQRISKYDDENITLRNKRAALPVAIKILPSCLKCTQRPACMCVWSTQKLSKTVVSRRSSYKSFSYHVSVPTLHH